MVFSKPHINKGGGNIRRKELKCSECGAKIELGDIYYSRITRGTESKNLIRYVCEACYEKKWIEC
jgi:hypothetical protein